MKVVHLARTPLAGSPIRIVRALNQHTDVQARLIVGNPAHYASRVFEGDLDWSKDREQAMAVIESADILHLHRYMDLERSPFGLDFRELLRRGKRILRQFHESPELIARQNPAGYATLSAESLPQLVIAQYHERFYPRARLVPNLVPIHEAVYKPSPQRRSGPLKIFYGPSTKTSAWSSRWDTKGYPETRAMLRRLAGRQRGVELEIHTGLPHAECMQLRRDCDIAIDEMVTGSYHLSSLESLSQGLPTFAYLDARVQATLRTMTGTNELPWLNYRLEDAEPALQRLIEDAELRRALGRSARAWMEQHWDDCDMVQHYVRAYRDIMEAPGAFDDTRFCNDNKVHVWMSREAADAEWRARYRRHSSWLVRACSAAAHRRPHII